MDLFFKKKFDFKLNCRAADLTEELDAFKTTQHYALNDFFVEILSEIRYIKQQMHRPASCRP